MDINNPIGNITQIGVRQHASLQLLNADDHIQYTYAFGDHNAANVTIGLDAAKSATPAVGNKYIATDTKKFYFCYATNTWTEIRGVYSDITNARGDILFFGANGWQRLPAGSANTFLQTKGASADPVWAAASPLAFSTKISGQDLSSTTVITIAHGLARAPVMVALTGFYDQSATIQTQGSGSWAGNGQNCIYTGFNTSGVHNHGNSASFALIITVWTGSSWDQWQATVTVDATNITITPTKSGTPTGSADIAIHAIA